MSFQKCRGDSMCLENCVWVYDNVDDSKTRHKGPNVLGIDL